MVLKNKILLLPLFLLVFSSVFSQSRRPPIKPEVKDANNYYKPYIGLGMGMFTYYGDLSKGKKDNGAILSRVAIDLSITQPFNDYLSGNFYFLKGKIEANERTTTRNINFQSDIGIWGVSAQYNFNHFLPEDRYIEPYFSLGIESLEFLTKTDLYDANGKEYNYWSDGTIRDLPETDPNKENAVRLERDYKYESDPRALNIDSFGKYKERTFAIPLGIGVNMKLNDLINFKLGTSLHLTFSDYIDGITDKSKGIRAGDKANDKLLFTSFSINYNINGKLFEEINPRPPISAEDLMAGDEDGDNVIDFYDLCPETPELVVVDENGCPVDTDKDGIADYLDSEPNSVGEVNDDGVAYTDDHFEDWYKMYMDSTGEFASFQDTIVKKHTSEGDLGQVGSDNYMVRIGEFSGGLPQDVAEELLNIKDVNTWEENGTTFITVGNYKSIPEALQRKLDLAKEGFTTSSLVTSDHKGKLKDVKPKIGEIPIASLDKDPEDVTIYRIQIGAFKKRLSKNIFRDAPNAVVVPFDDQINRYFSGAYTSFDEAAKAKINLISLGYKGAFIVSFKSGKRISLQSAGAKFVKGADNSDPAGVDKAYIDKSLITFSVQVGVYKTDVSPEELNAILKLKDVKKERTDEGLIRYYSGDFKTFEQAEAFKEEMKAQGLPESSVIGRFKNTAITAQEAIELLK